MQSHIAITQPYTEAALRIKKANCGYVINSSQELVEKILHLYYDKKLKQMLGNNARNYLIKNQERKV